MALTPEELDAYLVEEDLVDMLVDLVSIDSPTGFEEEIGAYMGERFLELGMDVRLQSVEEGRNNVLATWGNRGDGASLMLLGHMDCAPGKGEARGQVVDGWVVGKGAANMKAAFPCYYMAIRMLQQAGFHPRGQLTMAGVVGEIERAPIGDRQGKGYRGGGFGARYLATHSIAPDLILNGEPTGRRMQRANGGYLYLRVTTRGRTQHAAYKQHGVDAIRKMTKVIDAVNEWEQWYQENYRHPFIVPRVNIGGIEGGTPATPALVAAECHIFVDITILPNVPIKDVAHDFLSMLDGLADDDVELTTDVMPYMASNGYQISTDKSVVSAMNRAHLAVNGAEPEEADQFRCNVSSDNSVFNEYGSLGITYGPAGVSRTHPGAYAVYDAEYGEAAPIEGMVKCSKAYALAIAELMSAPRDELLD